MSEEEVKYAACLILGNRAVFYYPPGVKTGWTLSRLLRVSLVGFIFWSLVFMSVERFFA